MLKNEGKKIIMDEGDYGLPLIFKITKNHGQILNTDTIIFNIKSINDIIIEKEYTNLESDENGILYFVFSLTKDESDKLINKNYFYEVKAYRNNVYLNTLMENIIEVK